MMMVLALGMSMPDSMIVVHSSTLKRCFWKSSITCSSSRSGIWPCATPMRASGTSSCSSRCMRPMLSTSLCRKYTWPPRDSSRWKASFSMAASHGVTKVCTAMRLAGGVAMMDRSRRPAIAMLSVRGMGVAVSVNRCTLARSAFSASFWRTPKRCSSSTITRPRSLNFTSGCSRRCVPTITSSLPSARRSSSALISLVVLKRDSTSTFKGQSAKRSRKLR